MGATLADRWCFQYPQYAMARVPYVEPEELEPRVREALEAIPPLNVFRMLAHAGGAFRAYTRFGATILARLELGADLRELAILHVARRAEADYEWAQHEEVARAAGVSDAAIAAVDAGAIDDAARLDDAQRAVLAFTDAVLAGPRVADDAFAALAAHLSTREIVELLLTVGNYLMLARVMTVLDVDPDPPMGAAVVSFSQPRG
jgi:alkylhydroperoxidase family enzyme